MIKLSNAIVFLSLSTNSVRARYVFYYDKNHLNISNRTINMGIDHVIMASANSSLFNSIPAGEYTPFEAIPTVRSHFDDIAKVLISIGGWGDSFGFSVGAATSKSRKLFATNVAAMLMEFDFDGVDIDWEYPGGNGADYRLIPNSKKESEIDTFPLLLAELRLAIGLEKVLTITAPSKFRDMIVFTPDKAPSIWQSVDWVNVMTFDMMNRRDSITMHHSDVKSSIKCIDYYIHTLHLDPLKVNLGFALYAKWFTVDSSQGCESGLGCRTVPLEAADGSDTRKSGAMSFEAKSFGKPASNMIESNNGFCGPSFSKFCPAGLCCSIHGFCGDTQPYCDGCIGADYGSGCTATPESSFQKAMKSSTRDDAAGAEYFHDEEKSLFWTWDTPEVIRRKFFEVVSARGLGGIMVQSLGMDSYDFSHISALQVCVAEMKDAWLNKKLQLISGPMETGW